MSAGIAASIGSFLFLTLAFVSYKPIKTIDRMNGKVKIKNVSGNEAVVYNQTYDMLENSQNMGLKEFLIEKYFLREVLEKKQSLIKAYKSNYYKLEESDFDFSSVKSIADFLKVLLLLLSANQDGTVDPNPIMNIYRDVYSIKNLKYQLENDYKFVEQKLKKEQRIKQAAFRDFNYTKGL